MFWFKKKEKKSYAKILIISSYLKAIQKNAAILSKNTWDKDKCLEIEKLAYEIAKLIFREDNDNV